MKRVLSILTIMLAFLGCKESANNLQSEIFPDYSDVTVPCNIAPLNFMVEGADNIAVTIDGNSTYKFQTRGDILSFPIKKWKKMLQREVGNTLSVSVFVNSSEDKFATLKWLISPDSIDAFLSYRLIEPAYEVWSRIEIQERNMETFSTRLIGDNRTADGCWA